MGDDTWYGQLARWIIGGAFWTGLAIGGFGVIGIYKYKRRLQEKAKEEIRNKHLKARVEMLLNEVVHGETVEPASSAISENPGNTAEVAEMTRQSITRNVESLGQGLFPFENRTILPSSSSSTHSNDSETTLIPEDDDISDEVFEVIEECERRQDDRPENSNFSDQLEVPRSSPDIVRELAEAAEDCDMSTLQRQPVHVVYQM